MTLLTDPLLELLDDCELVVPVSDPDPELVVSDPELVVVAGDEDDATVLADERLASAGSWPDTSPPALSIQPAAHSATPPPTLRRADVALPPSAAAAGW